MRLVVVQEVELEVDNNDLAEKLHMAFANSDRAYVDEAIAHLTAPTTRAHPLSGRTVAVQSSALCETKTIRAEIKGKTQNHRLTW